MSRRTGWTLRHLGAEPHGSDVTWTFHAAGVGREMRVHVTSTPAGRVVDIQTSDYYVGTSGDAELDDRVVERVQQMIALHDSFRVLDEARGRDRRPASRWAA